jgi:hypothetical protein
MQENSNKKTAIKIFENVVKLKSLFEDDESIKLSFTKKLGADKPWGVLGTISSKTLVCTCIEENIH